MRDFYDIYGGCSWSGPDRRKDWVNPHQKNQTQSEAPYSYSEFFIFRNNEVSPQEPGGYHAKCAEGVEASYSDRLDQWNRDAYARAVKTVKGNGLHISNWHSKIASEFLTEYFGKPTTCCALVEGCNVGNGYPYWIFFYKHNS